jgi:hypothetical protein
MIQADGRYADSPLVNVTGPDGNTRQVIVPGPQEPYQFTYQAYQVTGSDRMDTMSVGFYGDPSKWSAIADANPEIMDWSNITPGTLIRVPSQ